MKEVSKKILTLPIRLALVILIIGALFKIMHWSFSKELMFFGGASIGVIYLIRFLNKKPKLILDYVKLALVLLWVLSYLINVFHLYSIPYFIEVCLMLLFVWWFIEEGTLYFKSRKLKIKGFFKIVYYALFVIAFIAMLFGVLFKVQHWPYGSELLTTGILITCLVLILDYFVIEQT